MFDADQLTQRFGFVPANHREPTFFPVESTGVYDDVGRVVPGYQRIARPDTGDTLGIHTESYALVPYERHFELFEQAIRKSELPWKNMLIGTDFSQNGARIFRQYLFPDATQIVGQDELALRIVMFDSYNGESAFIGKAGFFNFVCANESVMGKSILDVKFKHVGNMEERVAQAAEALTMSSHEFLEEMERLAFWPRIDVNVDLCEFLLKQLPQTSKRLQDELLAQWARLNGASLWDFHQMMSSWATHDIPAKTKADRQKRVASLVECDEWHSLEA